MSSTLVWIIVAVVLLCCLFVHRNLVKALVKGESMPKAPKWHCWVPKKHRKG